MNSAIWLNLGGAVLLVGILVAAVVHAYRALATDENTAVVPPAIVPEPGLAAARSVRGGESVRLPAAATARRAATGGRAYTMAQLAR